MSFTSEKRKKRVRGIEPPCAAWEAAVLPLNYTREEIFDFRLMACGLQAANNYCQEITSPEPENLFKVPPSAVKAGAGGGSAAAGPPPNAPFLPNDHTITPR
jgi:hypothetical protein